MNNQISNSNTNNNQGVISQPANTNSAVDLINLESIIKNSLIKINNLKDELKKEKEMFEDTLANDSVYNDHLQKVIQATNIKNETRKQILKQPAVVTVSQKVKDLRDEIKEIQQTLSSYLAQYQQLSGQNQIETENGEVMEIVVTARLVKKSTYRP